MSKMLHRSFKAGKCKTSLKLAAARIKLLKNKREVQLKQMKKELAQLLEAGQERTARIRVEHVVREEKTMAAYDLIEIYCELIAARLPIIESQKNCPIDLKEAIASVVFASPRCSDIPELSDVRKQVTAKYGKEFIASALELRPECGVSRMMVEKLSAVAPDGETKIKLLTLIAQEYNVKWDPMDFAEKESKPPEDLLNGPSISEVASNVPVANPTVQIPHRHDPKYESSMNFSETNVAEPAQSYQNFEHPYGTTRTSHPESRTSANAAERRASVASSFKEESAFSLNRQNWAMEFKDATSAAQAAAESAERASIAARAAAELSSIGRMKQQNSMGSQESFGNSYSDDGIQKSRGPMSTEHIEHSVKTDDLVRTSSHGMNSRMQDERRHRNGKENVAGVSDSSFDVDSITDRRANRSTQLGTKISFPDDDILVNNLPKADVYSQRSTFEVDATNSNWQTDKTEKDDFLGEVCMDKQSSEFLVESQDLQQNRQRIEHNNSGKGVISKPYDQSASISDGSASSDDVMLDSEVRRNGSDVPGHSSSIGQGNVQIGTKQPSFSKYPAAVFDDSGSDDDCNLAAESVFSHHEFDFYGPSEDRKSPSHIFKHTGSPTRQGISSLENSRMQLRFATKAHSPFEYSESTKEAAVPSQSSVLSATFDDSDGLYSDSDEEDAKNAKLGGRTDVVSLPLEHTALTRRPESLQTDRVHDPIKYTSKKTEATESYQKPWLHSSSDYLESSDVHSQSNLEAKPNVGGPAQEKQDHLQSSNFSRLLLAEEAKATDDLGYAVSSKDSHSAVVEEKRQPLQSSQLSFTKELKVRDDVNAQGVPDNMEDSKVSKTLSSETGQGLNFGRLSGGFRNKGYIRPPYNKGPSSDVSSQSREKSDEHTSATKEKPTSRSVIRTSTNSGALYQEPYNQKQVEVQHETSSRTPKTTFGSDSDNETEVLSSYQAAMNSGSLNQEPNNQKQVEIQHETSSRTPKTIFDSDSDNETEVVSPYQTIGNSGYSRRGLSRRTRDPPKQSQAPRFSSGSQVQASSERRKPSTSASYDTESVSGPPTEKARYGSSGESSLSSTSKEQSKAQNQVRNTQNSKLSTADTSVLQKTNKAQPQNKVQVYDEASELSQPSSIVKEPSLLHSSATSRETITPKSPSLSKALGSRENSLNKTSHVHPKLPDYDSFAAHFESLRSNRRSG